MGWRLCMRACACKCVRTVGGLNSDGPTGLGGCVCVRLEYVDGMAMRARNAGLLLPMMLRPLIFYVTCIVVVVRLGC